MPVFMHSNFGYLFRALSVWLIIILFEIIHGTLRELFLAPLVGDFMARRIALFSGMLLIFVITFVFIRWISAPTPGSLFRVGFMWVALTVVFEFGLGIYVLNYSWQRMFEDYDFLHGGWMGYGLLFMALTPLFVTKLRRIN